MIRRHSEDNPRIKSSSRTRRFGDWLVASSRRIVYEKMQHFALRLSPEILGNTSCTWHEMSHSTFSKANTAPATKSQSPPWPNIAPATNSHSTFTTLRLPPKMHQFSWHLVSLGIRFSGHLFSLGIHSLGIYIFSLGIYSLGIYIFFPGIYSLGIYSLLASILLASILSWHLFSWHLFSVILKTS